jgi:hypothetical protein
MSTTEMKKIWIKAALAFSIIISIFAIADAAPAPQIAGSFHGAIIINGGPAPIGTDVVAFSSGRICGRYVVRIEGNYGILNCDSNSLKDLRFEVNGEPARAEQISGKQMNLYIDSKAYPVPKGIESYLLAASIILILYLIIKERERREK